MTDTFIDISRRLAVRLPSPRWFVSPRRTATLQPGAPQPGLPIRHRTGSLLDGDSQ